MKYEVLARRYRPRQFDEVVGQEPIALTLRAGIQQGRVAHAYLFTGPRGVGKTSMARIFAKALNCPQAADRSSPEAEWGLSCDTCEVCDAIHIGQDIDVVEMDAASHRGIEDVRGIIESVNRRATRSPYKVFIVDEVHMLTREAFNALLKTLEEPPAHVKFIFATTEAHRIPDTVLSRCQRFDFHPIHEPAIVRRLEQILQVEKREAEDGLLEKIARYGRGGLRDSQTLLDQLLTYSESILKSEDLERITGRMSVAVVTALCDAVARGDAGVVLSELSTAYERGADPAVLLEQVLDGLRERLHSVAASVDSAAEDSSGELDRLLGVLQILLETSAKLRHSAYPAISVEVALLKVARLEDPRILQDMLDQLTALEGSQPTPRPTQRPSPRGEGEPSASLRDRTRESNRSAEDSPSAFAARPLASQPGEPRPTQRPGSTGDGEPSRESRPTQRSSGGVESATTSDASQQTVPELTCSFPDLIAVWGQIMIELREKNPQVAPFLSGVSPQADPGERDTIVLALEDPFYCQRMRSPQNTRDLTDLIRDVSRAPWNIKVVQDESRPTADTENGGGAAESSGAAASEAARGAGGAGGIAESELVEKAKKLFNGRVV